MIDPIDFHCTLNKEMFECDRKSNALTNGNTLIQY